MYRRGIAGLSAVVVWGAGVAFAGVPADLPVVKSAVLGLNM